MKAKIQRKVITLSILALLSTVGVMQEARAATSQWLLALNTPPASESGYDNLVTKLRKSTADDEAAQVRVAKPAPVRTASKALKPASPKSRVAQAGGAPKNGSTDLTVTPYTDSFFSSKVSPY